MKRAHVGLCASALAVFAATAAHAYTWKSFDGTGEWPTSGDVFIPKNTTIYVGDDEIDAVAGWENVFFENTLSKLVFTNQTKQAVYNAADTCNNGVIRAENCCGLTINSTNPNKKFTNGKYEFDNSVVTVTTDDGLCPGSTARLTYPAENSVGDLRFHKPAWDEAGWTGTKTITNRCNVFISCASKSGSVRAYIGSLAADEYFVQDANFYFVPGGANKYQGIRNNYEQISGDFGTCSDAFTANVWTGQNPWYAPKAGAQIRFNGTTAFTQNSPNGVLGCLVLGSTFDWYFGASGGYHSTGFSPNVGVVHFMTDNALHDTAASTIPNPPPKYVVLTPYLQSQSSVNSTNAWNLHGHALTVAGINTANGAVTEVTTSYHVFESAEPATLTLAEGWQQYYSAAKTQTRGKKYTSASYFVGAISVDAANAATNVFATKVSTSTGTMTVRNDSTVEFKWNGGWGSDIVVEDSGTVLFDQSNSGFAKLPSLEVKEGGKTVFAAAATTMAFASLKFGDTVIPPSDYYTLGTLRTKYGIGDYVEGADSVKVTVGLWQVFDGTGEWPTSGKVRIASGAQVTVDDDHVAAVAGWDVLGFANSAARLTFNNTTVPATLRVSDMIENGYLAAKDSCSLTIDAPNENGKFWGSYVFSNSYVIVTHDNGLCSIAAGCYLWYEDYDTNIGNLSFHKPAWDEAGWTGVKAITNSCKIFIRQSSAKKNYTKVRAYLGSSALDEYFVQNASVYFQPDGGYQMLGLRNNYEQISGDFGTCSSTYSPNIYMGQHAWYAAAADAQIHFNGTTAIRNNGKNGNNDWMLGLTILGAATDWHFGMSGGFHANAISPNCGCWHVMADDVFHDTADSKVETPPEKYLLLSPYAIAQSSAASTNTWILHGHKLAVAGLGLSNPQEVSESSTTYYVVESAEPATLTLAEGWYTYYATKYQTRGRQLSGTPCFAGAVSVVAANAATNVWLTKVSKPNGTLTVTNDTTVLFKWGAAWASDIAIKDGCRMVAEATAGSFKGANLAVDEGGTVEIAADTTVDVRVVTYKGQTLARGTYTKANCDFIEGDGSLYVRGPKRGLCIVFE